MINWNDYFVYDETSPSCLRWKVDRKRQKISQGDVAGFKTTKGYYRVKLRCVPIPAHRIVYYLCTGEVVPQIDHIDQVKTNNKIANLRPVDSKLNARNHPLSARNTSGFCGVHFHYREPSVQGKSRFSGWVATWRDLNGKPKSKEFSVNKYGDELARFMAEEYRDLMIRRMNLQGAGYTERHGK